MKTKEEIALYKKEYAQKNKEKIKEQQAEYYKNNSEAIKKRSSKRFSENKEEISNKQREYYSSNKTSINKKNRKYALNNKEKTGAYLKEYNKWKMIGNEKEFAEYYKNNKEEIDNKYKLYCENRIVDPIERKNKRKEWVKKYNQEYRKRRKLNDITYKLTTIVRSLIASSIKRGGYAKTSKTQDILGCTFSEFKNYLESKFEPWMNWNNYGNWNGYPKELNAAWDIDHMTPISTAETEEDIIKLSHYSNLQPLCSYTNRHIKSGKYSI